MSLSFLILARCRVLALPALLAAGLPAFSDSGWYDVRDGFPKGWEREAVDLKAYIQTALDAHSQVLFPGGTNPATPLIYAASAGIVVPDGRRVSFGANHRMVRLPSSGALFQLKDNVRFEGAIIDGNKYAHWPEFKELGKSEYGILMDHFCVVEDCVVFNNPGTGFGSWGDYNKLTRCLAENTGYIDVKFGVMFYQGSRDTWSGDGFYFRGTGNLIKECEAYDTFRWDFCASHSGARQNTFVDCRGGDVNLRTYGFIDTEGSDANNRLIRCISPNSPIVIPGSARTEVIQCMASHISAYDHENPDTVAMYACKMQAPLLDGNITTSGGIVLGGWSSLLNKHVPGAASPIVVNNRMYKTHSGPSDSFSDWSFSVHSVDGHGVVANNILFEFDDGFTKGPGLKLDNIQGSNNQVAHGQWSLDLPRLRLRYGYFPKDKIQSLQLQASDATLKANAAKELAAQKSADAPRPPLEAAVSKEGDSKPLAAAADGHIAVDFSKPGSREQVTFSGRHSFDPNDGTVLLQGSGAVFLKQPTGPGTYRVRFSLHEMERFEYHSNQIRFFVPDSGNPTEGGYSLQWSPCGMFTLKPGQTYMNGGSANPNRFKTGEVVELILTIPDDANGVYLAKPTGQDTPAQICAFRLADQPAKGYFGIHNLKWFSEVRVYGMSYER